LAKFAAFPAPVLLFHLEFLFAGISTSSQKHVRYLEKFCSDFISDLRDSIETTQKRNRIHVESEQREGKDIRDWLFEEVLHHAVFAKKKRDSFCGRKTLLGEKLWLLIAHQRNHF